MNGWYADIAVRIKRRINNERLPFLFQTGMRNSEILALQWGDIDWDLRIINVVRAWKEKELGPPKWGRNRIVPLTSWLEKELVAYLQDVLTCLPDHFVICWDNGEKVHRRTFYIWFRDAVGELGIDWKARNLTPYSLRHSRVTYLKQANVPLDVIQATIGHMDSNTTKGYTQFQPDYLLREIRKAEE